MAVQPLIRRSRPVLVEMLRVPEDYTERAPIARWCGGWTTPQGVAFFDDRGIRQEADAGDFIIRSNAGFYPAPADVVAAKYEEIL